MSEIEVPIEQAQEDMQHKLHESHGSGSPANMKLGRAAVMSAIIAVLAAVSALFAGHYSNEAMIKQIKSSDQWAFFQAKSIKAAVLESSPNPNLEKIEKYKSEQEEIKQKAEQFEESSEKLLQKHEKLATAVTFFQISIALTAIAVLMSQVLIIYVALALSTVGLIFMGLGFALV